MPAGTSWTRYISFLGSAMLAMFVGSQIVHGFYNPLDDFEKTLEAERDKYRKEIEAMKLQSQQSKKPS
ncbi:ubiquinol-cytochrome c reductase complex assembly factor 6-like isoform X2 [Tubulanus polymorphus]|uniref:ubiquinol-cytochrome c reductase complex assembly factor 6-like isoform X2 n=1 Tax=Tubulanus polymorphus TaxID=672921 RepID=UPI003DA32156